MCSACRVLVFALVCVLAAAVYWPLWADSSSPPGPTQQIVKLPDPVPAEASPTRDTSALTAPVADEQVSGANAKTPTQVAQLFSPTPTVGSAAELFERALECDLAWDRDRKAASLQQIAETFAGTQDAGWALVMLGRLYSETGRQAEAQAVLTQVATEYPDPQVQVFLGATAALCQAIQAKSYDGVKVQLLDIATDWSGTRVGAWAALQAGDLVRDYLDDYLGAIPYYQAAADAYPGSLIAEEAEVAIADCIAWSDTPLGEPQEVYRNAYEHVTNSRLKTRALLGLADMLSEAHEALESYDIVNDFLEQHPGSPFAPIALGIRSYTASQLGDFGQAVADATAFLGTPAAKNKHPWLHYAYQVLAQDAFRGNRIVEAEQYFASQAKVAPEPALKARALAGVAHCRAAGGDLRGAMEGLLSASETAPKAEQKCLYLYQAAQAAPSTAEALPIIARLLDEYPGSYLTSRLVGYEVLPPGEPAGGER